VPIVRELPFKRGATATDDAAASGNIMLDQGATDAFSRSRDQYNLVLSHDGSLLREC